MLINLAWKNIWRNKLRSGVILTAIILGLTIAVFIVAFGNGMAAQIIRDTLNREVPHLEVNRQPFLDFGDLEYAFAQNPIEEKVRKIPEVTGASPRIIINATASTSHNIGGVQLIGIDPEKEKTVFKIHQYIPDSLGSYFEDGTKNSIIVGNKFAEKYQIKLRNKVILTFADKDGEQFSGAFRVCGIYKTSSPTFEETNIFAKISDLRQMAPLPTDSIHELAITISNYKDPQIVAAVQNQIKAMLSGDETVRNWKDISPMLSMYGGFMGTIFTIVVAIVLFALGFVIVNVVLMSVMERRRELSMLRAIGMSRRQVMNLIVAESTILTTIGGFIGILLGGAIVLTTSHTGIDMSQSLSSYSVIGVSTMIYPTISFSMYLRISVMVIMTGILSAVYPARMAIKTKLADGVKGGS
jgi:ABC-type lipoprotein release transport system permease subunit